MVRRPPQLDPLSFTASRSCFRKTKRKRVVSWPSRRKSRISYFSQHYFQHFPKWPTEKTKGVRQNTRFSPGWWVDHPNPKTYDHHAWRALSEKLNSTGWSNEQKHVLLILESCYFEIPAVFATSNRAKMVLVNNCNIGFRIFAQETTFFRFVFLKQLCRPEKLIDVGAGDCFTI